MGTLIGTIITGAIIGAIARFFMRGRQEHFASLDHCLRRYRRGYRQLGGCSAGRCRNGWHRLDAWDSFGLCGDADHLPVPGHDRQEVTIRPIEGSRSPSYAKAAPPLA